MNKVIHISNCTECPCLHMKPFNDFTFQCRHQSFKTGAFPEVITPHILPDWCPLEDNNIAARCCAIALSKHLGHVMSVQVAESIASEYNIDLAKLRAGEYNV